jgi:hypothetical protein
MRQKSLSSNFCEQNEKLIRRFRPIYCGTQEIISISISLISGVPQWLSTVQKLVEDFVGPFHRPALPVQVYGWPSLEIEIAYEGIFRHNSN